MFMLSMLMKEACADAMSGQWYAKLHMGKSWIWRKAGCGGNCIWGKFGMGPGWVGGKAGDGTQSVTACLALHVLLWRIVHGREVPEGRAGD